MILTVFWPDNFDIIVENATGGGSVHTTHLVTFQEQIKNTSLECIHVTVPKTKSLNVNEVPVAIRFNDVKKKPPQFNNQHKPPFKYDASYITNYLLWAMLRKQNAFDQLIPIYSRWKLQTRSKDAGIVAIKATECYLSPTTYYNYETIHKYMKYLQL